LGFEVSHYFLILLLVEAEGFVHVLFPIFQFNTVSQLLLLSGFPSFWGSSLDEGAHLLDNEVIRDLASISSADAALSLYNGGYSAGVAVNSATLTATLRDLSVMVS
jgi:hypothetical protein